MTKGSTTDRFERWLDILSELCEGTNYEAQYNKAKSPGAKGVVIVPRGTDTPQRIAVYPKATMNPGLVIEMDIYKNYAVKAGLEEYGKDKSNRPHYGDVPEEKIIKLVKLFLNKE